MNLAKIKELEDLKGKLSELQKQSNMNFERDKAEFFEKGIQEFKAFFEEQGFDIIEDKITGVNRSRSTVILASYNDFKIDISIPSINTDYFGVISVWELNVYKNQTKYSLTVNEFGKGEGIRVRSTAYVGELTEDEKIEKEIIDINETIDKLEQELESNNKTILGFRLIKEEENENNYSLNNSSPQFKSMTELLNHLFS